MRLHGNARTCPNSRRLLVERIESGAWSLTAAADTAGVSERTACRWLARWRAEGETGLADRSSRPYRIANRTPPEREWVIELLRRLRMTAAEIAECLAMALSTVSADRAGQTITPGPDRATKPLRAQASGRARASRHQEAQTNPRRRPPRHGQPCQPEANHGLGSNECRLGQQFQSVA
jgi:hypothetical protein